MDEVEFGRYRLLSLLGEGGMGKVYKAHDTMMNRDVAIKVLPPELATEPGYEERFGREALMAGRLTEPHVIPVHEASEVDGRLYLVMPIIDGIDLNTLLERDGALTPQRAVQVIEQLAAALEAAHKIGLVHRDVKPSNALVTDDDFVYLIDFGIAHDSAATKLTQTGGVLGTFAYMSPERLNAGAADARSDVYALTCVLYECLTGEQPFPGNSMEQQVAAHLTQDPPKPSSHNPSTPKGFDEVIATGMAKDPDQRYQSARELAVAARRVLGSSASSGTTTSPATVANQLLSPTPAGSPSKRKWLIPAVIVLLVAAVGITVILTKVLSPKATAELVLTGATDPGANPFMTPASSPPPTNTKPEPTLQPQGNGPVATQPLPGDRDGLYGGTLNNAECDRDKMINFLSTHAPQANAFVEALNTDPTLFWSGERPLTAADIPTYLRELTPTVLRLDTRVTNHGFDGTHPTTLQSVFQTGTAVFIDAHGVPRARCYCGNPLTAPTALTGEPKPIGTPWAGYNPGGLAAVQPSKGAVTNFVLFDIVSGQFFNRPAGTTGADDTPHPQVVAPPGSASATPTAAKGPLSDIDGTYLVTMQTAVCGYGGTMQGFTRNMTVTHQGNVLTFGGLTGTVNADGSFVVTGHSTHTTWGFRGVFVTEGGHTIIRDGVYYVSAPDDCNNPMSAVKQ